VSAVALDATEEKLMYAAVHQMHLNNP